MMKLKSSWSKPNLGLSIYPEKAELDTLKDYLKLAKEYSFNTVFTNLIGLSNDDLEKYKKIARFGKDLGIDMIADVDKTVCDYFGKSIEEANFWSDLGISTIRLDVKFSPDKIADLSFNSAKMKIEINASDFSGLPNEIGNYKFDKEMLRSSHNFFPQKYTALSIKKFEEAGKILRKHDFKISSFVSLPKKDAICAWDDNDGGMPTLEICREMSLKDQVQLLSASYYNDLILVSAMYLDESEMKQLNNLDPEYVEFDLKLNDEGKKYKEIIGYDDHMLRGDNPNQIMWRSTKPRKVFGDIDIKPSNINPELLPGDVVVLNNLAGRYKGEVHIIKAKIPNEGKKNLVGSITLSQIPLLELAKPEQKFKFMIKS